MLFLFKAYDQTSFEDMSTLKFDITFQEQKPILYNNGTNDIPIFTYQSATNKTLTPLTAENVAAIAARYTNLDASTLTSDLTTATKPGLYYLELTFDHLFVEDIDNNGANGIQHHIALSPAFAATPIDNLEKWDMLQEAILGGSITVYITDTRQVSN